MPFPGSYLTSILIPSGSAPSRPGSLPPLIESLFFFVDLCQQTCIDDRVPETGRPAKSGNTGEKGSTMQTIVFNMICFTMGLFYRRFCAGIKNASCMQTTI